MIAPRSLTVAGSPSSVAPDRSAVREKAPARPPPPRLGGSWLASQGRLPLAFMGLGLTWLCVATGMLVAAPEVLAFPHAAPAVVTLAHAWVLGVFVTIATGAVYQIAPVALGTILWSERCGWWHFGLQAIAVPGMVFAFSRWEMALLGHFGAAFALGIFLFGINVWKTVRRSGHRDSVACALVLSAGWLSLTVLAGLTVAANRFWHFIPLDPLALLRAHAHLGLVGFFLTLLQGATFRLVPMFTLGDVPDWRPVRLGLWCSQSGLLGLTPALAWGAETVVLVSAFSILVGIFFSARALQQTLATRKKRVLDPGLRGFLVGGGALVIAALAGCIFVGAARWADAPASCNAMVYGVLIFAGGLLPAITGMMGKIVPFLTWMRAYGPKIGRVPTPAAGALSNPRLESWALVLQGTAVGPLVAGAWTAHPLLLEAGAWLLAGGIGLFLTNMFGIVRHLWRPVQPKPTPKSL